MSILAYKLTMDSDASIPVSESVQTAIDDNHVMLFSKGYCGYCRKLKGLFSSKFKDTTVAVVELDEHPRGTEIQAVLYAKTKQSTVPNLFIGGQHIGGSSDAFALHEKGDLKRLIAKI